MTLARKQLLFLLLSLADLALTYWLLRQSDRQIYEANPVARWWLVQYGAAGLACFKGAVALAVLILVAFIARHRPRAAGRILVFACLSLVLVVVYSATLCPAACREMSATKRDQEVRNLIRRRAERFTPLPKKVPGPFFARAGAIPRDSCRRGKEWEAKRRPVAGLPEANHRRDGPVRP
jgi:hypothetical protein